MMRIVAPMFFAALLVASSCGNATGQSGSVVAIENPSEFAESVSRRVAQEGMGPIRETFGQFGAGGTTPEASAVEGGLVVFERSIGDDDASVWNKIEDMSLNDQFRSIFYLHVFNDRTYLFTRYDFVRTGPRTWNLVTLTFGGTWQQVALVTTPGFRANR